MATRHNKASLERMLADHPFLKDLKPEHLQFMIECASEVYFNAGDPILYEGKEADRLYLILQGTVALGTFIPGRGLVTIETLDDGKVLGWSWLIPPHHWHFNAVAIMPVRAVAFDGKRLREKCETEPDFGYELLKRLAFVVGERLRMTRRRLEV